MSFRGRVVDADYRRKLMQALPPHLRQAADMPPTAPAAFLCPKCNVPGRMDIKVNRHGEPLQRFVCVNRACGYRLKRDLRNIHNTEGTLGYLKPHQQAIKEKLAEERREDRR